MKKLIGYSLLTIFWIGVFAAFPILLGIIGIILAIGLVGMCLGWLFDEF